MITGPGDVVHPNYQGSYMLICKKSTFKILRRKGDKNADTLGKGYTKIASSLSCLAKSVRDSKKWSWKGQQKKAKQQKIIVSVLHGTHASINFFCSLIFFYLHEEQDVVLGYSLNFFFLSFLHSEVVGYVILRLA